LRRCVWSRNIKNRCSIYIYIYIYIYDISNLRVNWRSDFLNESEHQFSALWSSVSWTWDYTEQRSRRRCLERRTPQTFFLFVITIIIRTAICLPPGGPTGNIPSTQLCCLDLLPWERKINKKVWNLMDEEVKCGIFSVIRSVHQRFKCCS